jgi:TP901 family phage tail tape measure protein
VGVLGEAVVAVGADTTGFRTQVDAGVRSSLASAAATMQSTGRTISGVGRKLTLGVTAPLALIGYTAIKTAGEFESTMNVLQANSGASAKSIQKLGDLAKQLGADTVFSANEAADAMLELSKGGFKVAEIAAGGVQATMALAATEGMNLADAATVVANNMNAFGIAAKDAGTIADTLAAGSAASTASVTSLSEGLMNVGGTARNFGMSLQDTVGTLAAFDQNAIRGAEGGTALNSLLSKLAAATPRAQAEMDKYGITLTDAQGRFKDITQIAGDFQKALGGLTDKEKAHAVQTIAGTFGQKALNALIKEGSGGIGEYIKKVQEQGVAQELADARMKGTAGTIEKMHGALETAALAIGTALAPAVTAVAEFVSKVADAFTQLPEGVQTGIVAFAGVAAALGPLLMITGSVITAMGTIGAAIGGISLAVAGPIAIIAALVAAIGLIVWKSQSARDQIAAAWQGFKNTVGPAFEDLKRMMEQMAPEFEKIGGVIVKALGPVIGFFASRQMDAFGAVFKGLVEGLHAAGNVFFGLADIVIQAMAVMVSTTVDGIDLILEGFQKVAEAGAAIHMPGMAEAAGFIQGVRDSINGFSDDFVAGSEKRRAALEREQYLWNLTGEQADLLKNRIYALPEELRTLVKVDGLTDTVAQVKNLARAYDMTPDQVVTFMQAQGSKYATDEVVKLNRLYDLTPDEVMTLIDARNVEPTKASVKALQTQLHLTPKQVTTIFKESGAKVTMKEARALIDVYGTTPKNIATAIKQVGAELTRKQVNALIDRYVESEKTRQAILRAIDNATPTINSVSRSLAALDGNKALVTITTLHRTLYENKMQGSADPNPDSRAVPRTVPREVAAGRALTESLAQGIRAAAPTAEKAMADTAALLAAYFPGSPIKTGPLKGWNGGKVGEALLAELVQGIGKGSDATAKAIAKAAAKMSEALQKEVDKIKSSLSSMKSDFQSTADSIAAAFTPDLFSAVADSTAAFAIPPGASQDYIDLVNAHNAALATQGNSATDNFIAQAMQGSAELQKVRAAFRKLRGWGVDTAFLAQLFASGNLALILDMAAGTRKKAMRAANLFGDITHMAGQLGHEVGMAEFGPKMASLTASLDKLREKMSVLNDLIKFLDKREKNKKDKGDKGPDKGGGGGGGTAGRMTLPLPGTSAASSDNSKAATDATVLALIAEVRNLRADVQNVLPEKKVETLATKTGAATARAINGASAKAARSRT